MKSSIPGYVGLLTAGPKPVLKSLKIGRLRPIDSLDNSLIFVGSSGDAANQVLAILAGYVRILRRAPDICSRRTG
jgi:hypothetical protein